MSRPSTRAELELEAAADLAADALAQHREAERMAAVNAMLRPQNTLKDLSDPTQAPEVAGAAFSPLLIAVRHLGGHPATDPGAVLAHLTALLGQTPEEVNGRLRDLSADHRLGNVLKRAQVRGDRELSVVLGGLILAKY